MNLYGNRTVIVVGLIALLITALAGFVVWLTKSEQAGIIALGLLGNIAMGFLGYKLGTATKNGNGKEEVK